MDEGGERAEAVGGPCAGDGGWIREVQAEAADLFEHLLDPGDQHRALADHPVAARGPTGRDRAGDGHHRTAQGTGIGRGALGTAAEPGLHHDGARRQTRDEPVADQEAVTGGH